MTISVTSEFKLEKHETSVGELYRYGFYAYRDNGHSMPKGFITSYTAFHYVKQDETSIEFSIQSPTGDASDHYHYNFPCKSWEQAKWIVDQQYSAFKVMLEQYRQSA